MAPRPERASGLRILHIDSFFGRNSRYANRYNALKSKKSLVGAICGGRRYLDELPAHHYFAKIARPRDKRDKFEDTNVIQEWLCIKTARWMAALSQFHRKKALIPANSGRRIHSKLLDGLSVLE
jgi:hypothetical protein